VGWRSSCSYGDCVGGFNNLCAWQAFLLYRNLLHTTKNPLLAAQYSMLAPVKLRSKRFKNEPVSLGVYPDLPPQVVDIQLSEMLIFRIGGMSMVKRRKYDKEFKREAVRLVLEEGRPAAEVERNLGTGSNMVSRWVREFREDSEYSFPWPG